MKTSEITTTILRAVRTGTVRDLEVQARGLIMSMQDGVVQLKAQAEGQETPTFSPREILFNWAVLMASVEERAESLKNGDTSSDPTEVISALLSFREMEGEVASLQSELQQIASKRALSQLFGGLMAHMEEYNCGNPDCQNCGEGDTPEDDGSMVH